MIDIIVKNMPITKLRSFSLFSIDVRLIENKIEQNGDRQ